MDRSLLLLLGLPLLQCWPRPLILLDLEASLLFSSSFPCANKSHFFHGLQFDERWPTCAAAPPVVCVWNLLLRDEDLLIPEEDLVCFKASTFVLSVPQLEDEEPERLLMCPEEVSWLNTDVFLSSGGGESDAPACCPWSRCTKDLLSRELSGEAFEVDGGLGMVWYSGEGGLLLLTVLKVSSLSHKSADSLPERRSH